jgi:hypothetical protein
VAKSPFTRSVVEPRRTTTIALAVFAVPGIVGQLASGGVARVASHVSAVAFAAWIVLWIRDWLAYRREAARKRRASSPPTPG